MQQRRFGTVRPRVKIPGPRPNSFSNRRFPPHSRGRQITAGSQFSQEASQLGCGVVAVVSRSELSQAAIGDSTEAWSWDAKHRTVRYRFKIPRRIGLGKDEELRRPARLCNDDVWPLSQTMTISEALSGGHEPEGAALKLPPPVVLISTPSRPSTARRGRSTSAV